MELCCFFQSIRCIPTISRRIKCLSKLLTINSCEWFSEVGSEWLFKIFNQWCVAFGRCKEIHEIYESGQ